MDASFHRWLLDAFDVRIQGDYGVDAVITADEARTMIEHATEFLHEARKVIAGSD
jgi:uncharacterized protein (UPF0332 family)